MVLVRLSSTGMSSFDSAQSDIPSSSSLPCMTKNNRSATSARSQQTKLLMALKHAFKSPVSCRAGSGINIFTMKSLGTLEAFYISG